MAKVKTDFRLARGLNLTKNDGMNIGTTTVKKMKEMISKGQSPVKGVGRFERYSGQKGGSYPWNVRKKYPGKRVRPVNLELTGKYLKSLTWWFDKKKKYVAIGFSGASGRKTPVSAYVRELFRAHNEGLEDPIPQRKHLPNKEGDQFAKTVERAYIQEFQNVIERRIEKMNRKSK